MRRFNYRQVFEKFFPQYYKENDSYKDKEGRGLLERLVTTCTEYLDSDIVGTTNFPGLDEFINLIDVDKTPEIFLNYLWEYLGEIPYAWGVLTNGQPYTKENLEKWLSSPKGYPKADPRTVLKYAISLYKIRGTKKFYQILGSLYGVEIDLIDHDRHSSILGEDFVKAVYGDTYVTYASDSNPEGITSQYPLYKYEDPGNAPDQSSCNECVYLEVYIKVPSEVYDEWIGSGLVSLSNVKLAFQRIVEKYMPIFCKVYQEEGIAFIEIERYENPLGKR